MFILEGTIGAGKSTLLRLLQENIPDISIAHEPLESWSSENTEKSLLAKFYESQARWAYTIETTTMMTRVRQHIRESASTQKFHVMERSIYSGHYCFALNGFKTNAFTQMEWELYLQWFQYLIPGKCKPPQGFIYLRVHPDIAYQRIQKRARSSEEKLPREYLQQIHEHYEAFLIEKKDVLSELIAVPVLTIDCNEDFEHSQPERAKLLQRISRFMRSFS